MTVGGQTSSAGIDQNLSDLAVSMRRIMRAAVDLSTYVNGQGNGLAFLGLLGYSSAANPNNPGGVSDAQWALNAIAYLNTVAGVYFGTVQAQGSGGNNAILFNFNNGLAPLWAGQIGAP